jgi:hypothetical protein
VSGTIDGLGNAVDSSCMGPRESSSFDEIDGSAPVDAEQRPYFEWESLHMIPYKSRKEAKGKSLEPKFSPLTPQGTNHLHGDNKTCKTCFVTRGSRNGEPWCLIPM